MHVPYRNLTIRGQSERSGLIEDLESLLDSGQFMMGNAVRRFERDFANYTERRGAVGVANGTSALYLSLRALGIGPGDEVVTTSMSWLATANAIIITGAKPVFVDVDDDLNICPEAVEAAITPFTRAILVVHFCGRVCAVDELSALAEVHGIALIEDASQAAGASFQERKAGYWGCAAAFSLNAMKPLGALGEAGIVVSDKQELLEKVLSLRYLGTRNIEICDDPELNHKMDEIQALWLSRRLELLESVLAERRKMATRLASLFPHEMRVIGIEEPTRTTFFEFTIEVDDRDRLKEYLEERGIDSRVKHPILMCDQIGYGVSPRPEVPNARRLIDRILSLPLHAGLTEDQIAHMIRSLEKFSAI